MTEKEKMLNADLYLSSNAVLSQEHIASVKLCREFNTTDLEKRLSILKNYALSREIIYL